MHGNVSTLRSRILARRPSHEVPFDSDKADAVMIQHKVAPEGKVETISA